MQCDAEYCLYLSAHVICDRTTKAQVAGVVGLDGRIVIRICTDETKPLGLLEKCVTLKQHQRVVKYLSRPSLQSISAL